MNFWIVKIRIAFANLRSIWNSVIPEVIKTHIWECFIVIDVFRIQKLPDYCLFSVFNNLSGVRLWAANSIMTVAHSKKFI